MTQIIIDKKKYVLLPQKEYRALQKKAALKTKPEKLLPLENARAYSKKLIRKWASEKISVKQSAAESIAAIWGSARLAASQSMRSRKQPLYRLPKNRIKKIPLFS